MRFNELALVAGAMAIVACSGGDKNAQQTSATQNDTAAAPATQNTGAAGGAGGAAGAGGAGGAGGSAAMAPITGKTVTVKMIGDGSTYKFDPANVTIKAGDGVKWVMTSGGPHNVAFINTPAAAQAQLSANMPDQMKELTSKMLMTANETYTMSFANVPAGKYDYHCEPHAAMGMAGSVTVQQ
jgi:plastocyanin